MDGIEWPKIGLGTYHLHGKQCIDVVQKALDIGYRLIDTAQSYENESEIGDAIKNSKVPRGEIILCTKLATTNLNPMGMFRSVQDSLRKLKTTYVDVLMIHWPKLPQYNPKIQFPALIDFISHGFCKSIGVSNFTVSLMEEALTKYNAPILVNQIELHAGFANTELNIFNHSNNIQTIAHTPLGQGGLEYFTTLQDLSKDYRKTVAQIGLAYVMSKNAIPIPKTTKSSHLKENYDAINLELKQADISRIDGLPQRRIVNPTFMNWDV